VDLDFLGPDYWLEPDHVLADIVAGMVNTMELPVGVTLIVKGMVLTGTLVSEREYLETLTDVFTSIARRSFEPKTKKDSDAIEEAFDFTHMAESSPAVSQDDDHNEDAGMDDVDMDLDDDDDITLPVRYLHLKDALILNPQPVMSFAPSLLPIMRLRLTVIDGWMLGHATPMDSPDDDEDVSGNGSHQRLH
jgi:hypothetical protein